ncbi:hypothetical protein NG895_05290 [Aeoliella sp. ICT_H6.2]|uniref:Uncharacterized protein n=1 Tax=Aeoliella straminimaris TaxID=2954799 RepID=A0A9X2F7K7_9BACT|nr:hypothetical protein [Aeoliella straminimaris]MCO6043314.1 hypothetical protein [Aeoliella straminimaris]
MANRLEVNPEYYAVGNGTEFERFDASRVPLKTVSHVTHLKNAVRVIEDGSVRADLVFDASCLNVTRTRVVWLSPNDWTNAGGYRYGNVKFTLDWRSLITGKKVYWVEAMDYSPHACRLLITDIEHNELRKFDPQNERGPWLWDATTDEHWWNGNYCLEVMLESDLLLGSGQQIDFVEHHANRCCIDHHSCQDKGITQSDAASEFLCMLADRSLTLPGGVFGESARFTIRGVWNLIARCISRSACRGQSNRKSLAQARACLAAFGRRDANSKTDFAELVSTFQNTDEAIAATRAVLQGTVGFELPE